MNEVFFSLVVATLNRDEELDMFLKSLTNSKFKLFEVVVVDQNQDNRLEAIISRYHHRFPIKRIPLEARNACRARNFGAASSKGRWITFPDDDCCYTPDTLATAKKLIDSNPVNDVLLGAVTDFSGKPLTKFRTPESKVSLFNMNGKMSEAAIFCTRDSFLATGGFDENFGPGGPFFAAEGYEYLARAMKAGQQVYFNSSIQILHPNKTQERDAAAFHIGYTRTFGVGCLLQKHFGTWAAWYLLVYTFKFSAKMLLWHTPVKRKYAIHCFNALIKGLFQNLRHA